MHLHKLFTWALYCSTCIWWYIGKTSLWLSHQANTTDSNCILNVLGFLSQLISKVCVCMCGRNPFHCIQCSTFIRAELTCASAMSYMFMCPLCMSFAINRRSAVQHLKCGNTFEIWDWKIFDWFDNLDVLLHVHFFWQFCLSCCWELLCVLFLPITDIIFIWKYVSWRCSFV